MGAKAGPWIAAALLAAAAGYYAYRGSGEGPPPAGERVVHGAGPAAGPAAPSPEASGSAAAPAAPASLAAIRLPPPAATLFNEYLKAASYRALYDRLHASPEGRSAEGKVVLYEILRQCATITEGARPGFRSSTPRREDFVAGIPATDPNREKRIAAFDSYAVDKCTGFEGVSLTRADLLKLLDEAASTGDPRARALALEQELWQARRTQGRDSVTLTDSHVDTLRALVGSKDPEAIRVGGRIMANSWNDYALRVGPEQQPVEPKPFMNAFLLLACEYGAPCGADTPRMLQACAFQGHCDAQSFPEYLHHYGATPYESEMVLRYRAVLRTAIETGDWSQVVVARGQPAGNRMTFIPGPR